MTVNTDADADVNRLSSDFMKVSQDEDGEWQITAYIGGESE